MKEFSNTASTDTAVALMADPRRRNVLQYLMDNGEETVTIGDLVAEVEYGDSQSRNAGQNAEERRYVELQQKHLPKLDEAGAIDYDARSGTLRNLAKGDLEKLLQFVTTLE